ncbi:SDR family NAD(P)-dependent oxidoreductase [Herbiconiux daphne]|uniref:SDR family oxidoreductase n=1 Tax=Herbiconiux daphne TaxID=2970914 RepID=A0ABT2H3L6_9MICO|nr:SDR family oxidoreductase [Herbiconiux daphne]MCS5734529.1 SDR family oxidoreductase [Herbiconiux daphne]
MTNSLQGQTALITGAGRGIGRSIALELARAGASVGLFARRQDDLETVAGEVEAAGGRALVLTGDVTSKADVDSAVAALTDAFGPIDFLVNNAGRSQPYGPVGTVDPEAWWDTQAIHVLGPMLFMSAVLPSMLERGHGRILNVASMAGVMIGTGSSAYTVSKATVIRLSEHVHAEHHDAGVSVFVVHPGSIVTDMVRTSQKDPAAPQRFGGLKPERAEADLERVGRQAVALASGEYDALAGSLLDLEKPLDESLAAATA